MAKKAKEIKALPTIWKVSDELWARVEPVLSRLDPPKTTGRKRVDPRSTMEAIIFRLRSGCQWNHLPRKLSDGTEFPDDSSVHRTFQRWVNNGVFVAIWAELVKECDALDGVEWEWQSVDCSMGKSRLGGMP